MQLSVIVPLYNEEESLGKLFEWVDSVMTAHQFDYEIIFIDNASQDGSQKVLRDLAIKDHRVKVIMNTRNFGHIRSGYHALFQASGDAIIGMASDLEDPPELITEFLRKWEQGYKIVLAVKKASHESRVMFKLRQLYYFLLKKASEAPLISNATGFGLYDRRVIDLIKDMQDPYPYFRGMLAELGFELATVDFVKPVRRHGKSSNNIFILYDNAILGFVSHSKLPLRMATLTGFVAALLSLTSAVFYFFYKMLYWDSFTLGIAPLVIGFFLISSLELIFIGMLGEYVGFIHHKMLNRPIVVEKERINF